VRTKCLNALAAALITAPLALGPAGCGESGDGAGQAGLAMDLRATGLHNPQAYIPSQCYTKTEDEEGRVHNPCYACHVESRRPNYINDADLQQAYAFPDRAFSNRWTNLFEDRGAAVDAQSDQAILAYVRQDNYLDADGEPRLASILAEPPAGWDFDGDGRWDGYVPDSYFQLDERGFDRDPEGRYTGWRAFAYYPFLGTFWPTNGSTDDVLIRLAPELREDENGTFDPDAYRLNLTIVEAVVKEKNVAMDPVDESRFGVDLDKDGVIGTASQVTYDWAPLEGRTMSYVGRALVRQRAGELKLAAGLYPLGTELLHSVRYIDVTDDGIALAPRLKELRYARKVSWRTYAQLEEQALAELKESHDFPDRLRLVRGDVEHGVSNDQGWVYQGFIEDAGGDLRPQTFEESVFCVGCHGGVGATRDGVFSFHRKLDHRAHQQGWYHWTQEGIQGLPEPRRADGRFEYTAYLEENGAGDELRENDEVRERFFTSDGALDPEAVDRLHQDIGHLLLPSRERALTLNKAYRAIVQDQDFVHGRDPTVLPAENVHRSVKEEQPTGVTEPVPGPGRLSGT
jgi:hypothetical protein